MRHRIPLCMAALAALVLLAGCVSPAPRKLPAAAPIVSSVDALPRLDVPTADAGHDLLAQLMAGQFALDHSDLKQAAQAYIQASTLSQDPAVAKLAAQLALATHDNAAARQTIRRWVALGGKGADLHQLRARLALGTGDADVARKQLLALVQSGEPQVWRTFGRLLMDSRDAAQAGVLLKRIATVARLPADPVAWLAMSELGTKLGQQAYAQKVADAALKRFACADCYAWASQLAYRAGDTLKARKLYARAVAKAPDNPRFRVGYAAMLADAGQPAAAARLLAKGKQNAHIYQLRAAYAAQAKDNHALAGIYAALQHETPEVLDASHYLLGQLAEVLGKPDKALDWFAQVPADNPHRFDADLHSAVIWQNQGKLDQAHGMARQMQLDYASDPDKLAKAWQLDAELYMGGRHFEQAAASYSRALELKPKDADLLYGRGIAHAEAGEVDAAVHDLRAVLAARPGDINAANALGYTLADAGRDLAQASALIERAHQARPEDPAIIDSWGWLQYRLGHLDKAAVALRQAWQAGKDPQVGGHLAEVLWKQGHAGQALKVLTAARKLAPEDARLRALQAKIAP